MWNFDFSPAYIGYGMIIKPSTSFHMLLGAIVGWGILSPIAKTKGWAPGPVNDWNEGSRGWILWVSLGLIIGDSTVGLGWLTLRPIYASICTLTQWSNKKSRHISIQHLEEEISPLLRPSLDNSHIFRDEHSENVEDELPKTDLVTPLISVYSTLAVFLLCVLSLWYLFHEVMPTYNMLLAIISVPLASIIAIRSLGETDHASTQSISK